MSVLDDVLVNVKSAAEAAGQAANRFVDASRLRMAAAEVRTELDKTYKKLGQAVYASTKSEVDCPELIDDYVSAIDELTEQLRSITDAAESVSPKAKCAVCGTTARKGDVFCSKCGSELL